MDLSHQHLQALYQACYNTNLLWHDAKIFNLKQLELPFVSQSYFLRKLEKRLRLGQLAEQFVFNQIETCDGIELLAENIQIQKEKHTIGELDALITVEKQPIHLEIIYKFYVHDPRLGHSELECWIGPNRKDSLIEKLTKLKERQLPLLYAEDCKSILKQLKLEHFNFEQQVIFKAQLFVPYLHDIAFEQLNENCVCGFYITINQLELFRTCEFYIPTKIDWFLDPNDTVEWLGYKVFSEHANVFLNNQQSPLFWMKNEKKVLSKGFLVWWSF